MAELREAGSRVKPGLHLIADDLAEPGWIFWDWILFTRWLKAWTAAA